MWCGCVWACVDGVTLTWKSSLAVQVEKCLRGQSRFIILEARNDGTKFTTSSLRNLSEEHQSLKKQYHSLQASLVSEVVQIAAGYAEPLLELNLVIARLDVIVSFASASATAPISYVRPTITNRGECVGERGGRRNCVCVCVCVCVHAGVCMYMWGSGISLHLR